MTERLQDLRASQMLEQWHQEAKALVAEETHILKDQPAIISIDSYDATIIIEATDPGEKASMTLKETCFATTKEKAKDSRQDTTFGWKVDNGSLVIAEEKPPEFATISINNVTEIIEGVESNSITVTGLSLARNSFKSLVNQVFPDSDLLNNRPRITHPRQREIILRLDPEKMEHTSIDSGDGDVQVLTDIIAGTFSCRTRDGDITLKRVLTDSNLRSNDGAISATVLDGNTSVKLKDGSLTVNQVRGSLTLRGKDCDLTISDAKGKLDIKNNDDDITIKLLEVSDDSQIITRDGEIDILLYNQELIIETAKDDGDISLTPHVKFQFTKEKLKKRKV